VLIAFHFAETKIAAELHGLILEWQCLATMAEVVPDHRRRMLIKTGVLPLHYVRSGAGLKKTAQSLRHYPPGWRGFVQPGAFDDAFEREDVFALVSEGLAPADAAVIDDRLHAWPGYLGSFQLQRGEPLHEALYLMSLPARYEVDRRTVWRLVDPAADEDEQGLAGLAEHLGPHGIEQVSAKTSLIETMVDPYHNPEFSKMAGRLELRLSSHLDSVVSAIMVRARESDPRLVEALDAAMGTLDSHINREQLAQVAISCRRFLERLADAVYPPKPEPVGGRKVGKAEYKNRLWAFAKEQLGPGDVEAAEQIGKRVDAITMAANKGLHGDPSIDEIRQLVVDLTFLTYELLKLTPPDAYLSEAYSAEVLAEVRKALE
jgi:hypothetical protein